MGGIEGFLLVLIVFVVFCFVFMKKKKKYSISEFCIKISLHNKNIFDIFEKKKKKEATGMFFVTPLSHVCGQYKWHRSCFPFLLVTMYLTGADSRQTSQDTSTSVQRPQPGEGSGEKDALLKISSQHQ